MALTPRALCSLLALSWVACQQDVPRHDRLSTAAPADTPGPDDEPVGETAEEAEDEPQYETVRFAVVGDFGWGSKEQAAVAAQVADWEPDFVITTGDNNCPSGASDTIDANIGQHYHSFIHPYAGSYGEGADSNRFFPCLGNHDWLTEGAQPHLDYFELPGYERYYDFQHGAAHFFCVDSDASEPDGVTADSLQAAWLQEALAASTAPFQVVYLHHPPHSSGSHGDNANLQWPFRDWGADLLLAGHDHSYERLVRDGLLEIVNGSGGAALRGFSVQASGSQVGDDQHHGAQLVTIDGERAVVEFFATSGELIDQVALHPGQDFRRERTLLPAGSSWRYLDGWALPEGDWTALAYDDSGWSSGAAPLGYGEEGLASELSYGDDSADKPITAWFRTRFDVQRAAAWDSLQLALRRDDGALVYVNGTEALRSNMPEGQTGASTTASVRTGGKDETAFFSYELDPALLRDGENQLAVEVHQFSADSSDLVLDLELSGSFGVPLVASGASWRFWDQAEAPVGDWTASEFDHTDWATGSSPLGYGNGDEATVIGYGGDDNQRHITTWFRHSFQADQSYQHLLLRLARDDGAAVYLNGTEVLRSNLPTGELSSDTVAAGGVDQWFEEAFLESMVDASLLEKGWNMLAVEVHQSSAASSDLRMDLELLGM